MTHDCPPLLVGISEGTLSLDASGSYDPDSGKTALTVVWSCAVVKENNWDPGVCGGNLTEDATIAQPLAAYGAGTYAFSAFVVSADGRNTSTSVVIEVRGGAGALVAAVRVCVGACVCVCVCVCVHVADKAAVGNKCPLSTAARSTTNVRQTSNRAAVPKDSSTTVVPDEAFYSLSVCRVSRLGAVPNRCRSTSCRPWASPR